MTSEWTAELSLDHELLDRQHAQLFRRLQEAAAALDGAPAGVEAALAAFADALSEHVATEEQIMEDTLYPERVRHRSAHELFVTDLARLREELHAQGPTSSVARGIRVRIPEWLRFHVRVNDLPLGSFLARRRRLGHGPATPGDGRRLS